MEPRIYEITYGLRDISHNSKEKLSQKVLSARPMTEDQVEIWRAWLPSTLRVHDLPILPSRVDEKLREHRGQGILQDFEVWATDDNVTEFTLCGVLDGKYYRIARWSTEFREVIAYDDLKGMLKVELKQKMNTRQIGFQLFPGTFMFLCVTTILGLAAITWFRPSALLEWLFILVCMVALSTTIFYRIFGEWMQQKYLKEDRLKIAIDNDNAKNSENIHIFRASA